MLISHIGCYIYRYVLIAETVELLRATYHEEYISVTFVAYWDQVHSIMANSRFITMAPQGLLI